MIIYIAWIVVSAIDALAAFLTSVEMWKESKRRRAALYLAHSWLATALRAITTIIGLSLFGLNVRSRPWYLILGLLTVSYQAFSSSGFVLYSRGIINGGGWLGLFRRQK